MVLSTVPKASGPCPLVALTASAAAFICCCMASISCLGAFSWPSYGLVAGTTSWPLGEGRITNKGGEGGYHAPEYCQSKARR